MKLIPPINLGCNESAFYVRRQVPNLSSRIITSSSLRSKYCTSVQEVRQATFALSSGAVQRWVFFEEVCWIIPLPEYESYRRMSAWRWQPSAIGLGLFSTIALATIFQIWQSLITGTRKPRPMIMLPIIQTSSYSIAILTHLVLWATHAWAIYELGAKQNWNCLTHYYRICVWNSSAAG